MLRVPVPENQVTFHSIGNENNYQVPLQQRSKYPRYRHKEKRMASYRNQHLAVSKEEACDAGFFHTGVKDLIRCYQCGYGLKNWAENDDPKKEHVTHSPDCQFVKLKYGDDYIKNASRKEDGLNYEHVHKASEENRNRAPLQNLNTNGQLNRDQEKQKTKVFPDNGDATTNAIDAGDIILHHVARTENTERKVVFPEEVDDGAMGGAVGGLSVTEQTLREFDFSHSQIQEARIRLQENGILDPTADLIASMIIDMDEENSEQSLYWKEEPDLDLLKDPNFD